MKYGTRAEHPVILFRNRKSITEQEEALTMIDRKRSCNIFLPLALCAAVALLAACGDTTKKSTSPASASAQAAVTVGMSACTTCHTVVTDDWLTSKHANLDPDGTLNSPGIPSSAQVTAGACADCHDPTGD